MARNAILRHVYGGTRLRARPGCRACRGRARTRRTGSPAAIAASAALLAMAAAACTPPVGADLQSRPASAPASATASPDCVLKAETGDTFGRITIASLVGSGVQFAAGTATGYEPASFNTPDGRRPADWTLGGGAGGGPYETIYTPVDVEIDLPLTTAAPPAGPGRVLVRGGKVGCDSLEGPGARPEIGSRYVFLLEPARDAKGDPFGQWQEAIDAWPVDSSGTVGTLEGPLSLPDLRARVDPAPTRAP